MANKKKEEAAAPFVEETKTAPVQEEKKEEGAPSKIDEGDPKYIGGGIPEEFLTVLKDLQRKVQELEKRPDVSISAEEQETLNAKDDYLETPAIFFALAFRYRIHGDKRYGRESLPPLREAIVFKEAERYRKHATNGKGMEMISICQTVVRSKATAQWLREHSFYGIKFFENLSRAKNVNITLMEKMAEMNTIVTSMNDYAVVERAKLLRIPIESPDMRELRKELVRKMAEKELKNQGESLKAALTAPRDENGRVYEWKNPDVNSDIKIADNQY